MDKPHCKRSTGTDRRWSRTYEEAVKFSEDPANTDYHGDVAHFCEKCEWFHLSKPEWLTKTPNRIKHAEDYIRMLDEESELHEYYSLALVVYFPNGSCELVHNRDIDRARDLSKMMRDSGVPAAVLAIVKTDHGFFSCAKKFDGAGPQWQACWSYHGNAAVVSESCCIRSVALGSFQKSS